MPATGPGKVSMAQNTTCSGHLRQVDTPPLGNNVVRLRLLPWEYGIRNLFRRPTRTGLTLAGLTTVVLLVFVVVAFILGLDASLAVSGDPRAVLVYSIGAAEDIENSAIPARIPPLLSASLQGIERRYGVSYVSPEL